MIACQTDWNLLAEVKCVKAESGYGAVLNEKLAEFCFARLLGGGQNVRKITARCSPPISHVARGHGTWHRVLGARAGKPHAAVQGKAEKHPVPGVRFVWATTPQPPDHSSDQTLNNGEP